jgi:methionyl-tRNA formyltransferase
MSTKLNIAFFGTPDRAVYVLNELKAAGILPSLIITQPDRPQGRKLVLTPPPVKVWAQKEKIEVLQPDDLSDKDFMKRLKDGNFDTFVVVAYGKILKDEILNIPKHGSLNLHASLLPKLRGSCPIETAILQDDKNTGVSIIKMDKLMDHGPVIASKEVAPSRWPLPADDLAKELVTEGGKLFAEILPKWVSGKIDAKEQDHEAATYTKKITKEDGLMDLSADGYTNFLKWNAYKGWPGSYFFTESNKRVVITEADFTDGTFKIKKVIPEGKKEISWEDFSKQN